MPSRRRHALPSCVVTYAFVACSFAHGQSPISPSDQSTRANQADAPSASLPEAAPEASACELATLSSLGWQDAFDPAGYEISAVLPPNTTFDTWESLGCLSSLVNLSLAQGVYPLPDAWATNGSFPLLQSLDLSTTDLSGTLPPIWAQPGAFPQLQILNLSFTRLEGTLPREWGQQGAFSSLSQLLLTHTSISGKLVAMAAFGGSVRCCQVEHCTQMI